MTEEDLRLLVEELRTSEGDTSRIEAKAAAGGLPARLWETLSAFANTPGGGVLLLGFDEKSRFEAVSVKHPHKIQQDLASLCDQMIPPLRLQIEIRRFEGKPVVSVEVPEIPREQKPCHYKGAGLTNGAFIRVADGDRKLTSYEVQMLLANRGQPREDERPIKAARLEDLDKRLLKSYCARVRRRPGGRSGRLSDEEILRREKALVRSNGDWVPSLAGLMVFGKRVEDFLTAPLATMVAYPAERVGEPGPRGERFLDNPPPFHGNLIEVVPALLDRIRRNMKRRALVRGLFREDLWEYPETALREVLVNALAHRDLSESSLGSPVQVQLFPNRMAVSNPGGLFGPVTVDRLGEEGVSSARNARLMRILEDIVIPGEEQAICENRGSGMGAILAALRRAGMNPPEFDDSVANFRATFSNASLLDEPTLRWIERIRAEDLADSQKMALAMLRHGREMDNATYRNASGLDSRVATQELGSLVERGFVEQRGTRRWAKYVLAPRLAEAASAASISTPRRRRNRRDEFKALLQAGPMSRREIEQMTGLKFPAVRYWLSRLIKEGAVVGIGSSSRAKNMRYSWRKP